MIFVLLLTIALVLFILGWTSFHETSLIHRGGKLTEQQQEQLEQQQLDQEQLDRRSFEDAAVRQRFQ